jgi:hypothetical protein
MKRKIKALALKPRIELGFVFFLLLGMLAFFITSARAEEIAACERAERYENSAMGKQREIDSQRTLAAENNAVAIRRIEELTSEIESIRSKAENLKSECSAEKETRTAENTKCKNMSADQKKYFEYNKETGRCEEKEFGQNSNPESGECNNAEIFKGTNWKGEACKKAATTVKNVQAQQEAVGASAQAIATTYSSMQAQQANGQQADAYARQQKILQALAISKIATGAVQLAGAGQLKSAAGNAEAASSTISQSHKEIAATCANEASISEEACFYREASAKGLPSDAAAYANFDRMRSAASQSQEQADAANAMAKASMVTGLADTIVGLQALQMSRQAQQQAVGMGQVPQPIPGYQIGDRRSGGLSPGLAPGGGTALPTDYGLPGEGGGEFGVAGGGMGNGIKDGKGFAVTPGMKIERSSVSAAGGGGGAGALRGGGGGGGGKKSGKTAGNTAGEYQIGGGGGGGFKGAAGPAKDEKNPFAEALAKLFPPDKNGNPVVDSRTLASEPMGNTAQEDAFVGSEVYASDPSIFEQIRAKYQQLTNKGQI